MVNTLLVLLCTLLLLQGGTTSSGGYRFAAAAEQNNNYISMCFSVVTSDFVPVDIKQHWQDLNIKSGFESDVGNILTSIGYTEYSLSSFADLFNSTALCFQTTYYNNAGGPLSDQSGRPYVPLYQQVAKTSQSYTWPQLTGGTAATIGLANVQCRIFLLSIGRNTHQDVVVISSSVSGGLFIIPLLFFLIVLALRWCENPEKMLVKGNVGVVVRAREILVLLFFVTLIIVSMTVYFATEENMPFPLLTPQRTVNINRCYAEVFGFEPWNKEAVTEGWQQPGAAKFQYADETVQVNPRWPCYTRAFFNTYHTRFHINGDIIPINFVVSGATLIFSTPTISDHTFVSVSVASSSSLLLTNRVYFPNASFYAVGVSLNSGIVYADDLLTFVPAQLNATSVFLTVMNRTLGTQQQLYHSAPKQVSAVIADPELYCLDAILTTIQGPVVCRLDDSIVNSSTAFLGEIGTCQLSVSETYNPNITSVTQLYLVNAASLYMIQANTNPTPKHVGTGFQLPPAVSQNILLQLNQSSSWASKFRYPEYVQEINLMTPLLGAMILNTNNPSLIEFFPEILTWLTAFVLTPAYRRMEVVPSHFQCSLATHAAQMVPPRATSFNYVNHKDLSAEDERFVYAVLSPVMAQLSAPDTLTSFQLPYEASKDYPQIRRFSYNDGDQELVARPMVADGVLIISVFLACLLALTVLGLIIVFRGTWFDFATLKSTQDHLRVEVRLKEKETTKKSGPQDPPKDQSGDKKENEVKGRSVVEILEDLNIEPVVDGLAFLAVRNITSWLRSWYDNSDDYVTLRRFLNLYYVPASDGQSVTLSDFLHQYKLFCNLYGRKHAQNISKKSLQGVLYFENENGLRNSVFDDQGSRSRDGETRLTVVLKKQALLTTGDSQEDPNQTLWNETLCVFSKMFHKGSLRTASTELLYTYCETSHQSKSPFHSNFALRMMDKHIIRGPEFCLILQVLFRYAILLIPVLLTVGSLMSLMMVSIQYEANNANFRKLSDPGSMIPSSFGLGSSVQLIVLIAGYVVLGVVIAEHVVSLFVSALPSSKGHAHASLTIFMAPFRILLLVLFILCAMFCVSYMFLIGLWWVLTSFLAPAVMIPFTSSCLCFVGAVTNVYHNLSSTARSIKKSIHDWVVDELTRLLERTILTQDSEGETALITIKSVVSPVEAIAAGCRLPLPIVQFALEPDLGPNLDAIVKMAAHSPTASLANFYSFIVRAGVKTDCPDTGSVVRDLVQDVTNAVLQPPTKTTALTSKSTAQQPDSDDDNEDKHSTTSSVVPVKKAKQPSFPIHKVSFLMEQLTKSLCSPDTPLSSLYQPRSSFDPVALRPVLTHYIQHMVEKEHTEALTAAGSTNNGGCKNVAAVEFLSAVTSFAQTRNLSAASKALIAILPTLQDAVDEQENENTLPDGPAPSCYSDPLYPATLSILRHLPYFIDSRLPCADLDIKSFQADIHRFAKALGMTKDAVTNVENQVTVSYKKLTEALTADSTKQRFPVTKTLKTLLEQVGQDTKDKSTQPQTITPSTEGNTSKRARGLTTTKRREDPLSVSLLSDHSLNQSMCEISDKHNPHHTVAIFFEEKTTSTGANATGYVPPANNKAKDEDAKVLAGKVDADKVDQLIRRVQERLISQMEQNNMMQRTNVDRELANAILLHAPSSNSTTSERGDAAVVLDRMINGEPWTDLRGSLFSIRALQDRDAFLQFTLAHVSPGLFTEKTGFVAPVTRRRNARQCIASWIACFGVEGVDKAVEASYYKLLEEIINQDGTEETEDFVQQLKSVLAVTCPTLYDGLASADTTDFFTTIKKKITLKFSDEKPTSKTPPPPLTPEAETLAAKTKEEKIQAFYNLCEAPTLFTRKPDDTDDSFKDSVIQAAKTHFTPLYCLTMGVSLDDSDKVPIRRATGWQADGNNEKAIAENTENALFTLLVRQADAPKAVFDNLASADDIKWERDYSVTPPHPRQYQACGVISKDFASKHWESVLALGALAGDQLFMAVAAARLHVEKMDALAEFYAARVLEEMVPPSMLITCIPQITTGVKDLLIVRESFEGAKEHAKRRVQLQGRHDIGYRYVLNTLNNNATPSAVSLLLYLKALASNPLPQLTPATATSTASPTNVTSSPIVLTPHVQKVFLDELTLALPSSGSNAGAANIVVALFHIACRRVVPFSVAKAALESVNTLFQWTSITNSSMGSLSLAMMSQEMTWDDGQVLQALVKPLLDEYLSSVGGAVQWTDRTLFELIHGLAAAHSQSARLAVMAEFVRVQLLKDFNIFTPAGKILQITQVPCSIWLISLINAFREADLVDCLQQFADASGINNTSSVGWQTLKDRVNGNHASRASQVVSLFVQNLFDQLRKKHGTVTRTTVKTQFERVSFFRNASAKIFDGVNEELKKEDLQRIVENAKNFAEDQVVTRLHLTTTDVVLIVLYIAFLFGVFIVFLLLGVMAFSDGSVFSSLVGALFPVGGLAGFGGAHGGDKSSIIEELEARAKHMVGLILNGVKSSAQEEEHQVVGEVKQMKQKSD